jgi:transposase
MKTHHHPNRALSQNEMEARRLKAVPYFKRGWSLRRMGKKLGVSAVAVCQWKAEWKKSGRNGLLSGQYGPASKLSPKKEKEVRKKILKGAEANGFSGDFWTLGRITSAVKTWTGILYQERSVWHVLKRLGFSCQKPVKRAAERDEKAIREWRQKTWVLLKKGASKTA